MRDERITFEEAAQNLREFGEWMSKPGIREHFEAMDAMFERELEIRSDWRFRLERLVFGGDWALMRLNRRLGR